VLVVVVRVVDELVAVPVVKMSIWIHQSGNSVLYLAHTGYTTHYDTRKRTPTHRWWLQTSCSLRIGRTGHSARQQHRAEGSG
jgi:hypothetical protein